MKIGFILLSDSSKPIPSTRVAVLNILPRLKPAGIDAEVVYQPTTPSEVPELPASLFDTICAQGLDVVVFQKVHGPSVLSLVNRLMARGIPCVYLVCDLVDEAMARQVSGTIVVTEFLRSLYPAELSSSIHVVHDGIERPEVFKPTARRSTSTPGDPLRAVLVTSTALQALPVLIDPPKWLQVTIVAAYPSREQRLQRFNWARWSLASIRGTSDRMRFLRFLSNPRIRLEAWHPEGVYRHLMAADIGVIPIDTRPQRSGTDGPPPSWAVKSENRLTLKMSAGLPVVATPIPSYLPVVEQGRNAFLASGLGDWMDALEQLRDPDLRERMGQAARQSVRENYSIQQQARRFIDAVSSIAGAGGQLARPTASAIDGMQTLA